MMRKLTILFVAVSLLSGCGVLTLPAVINEQKQVSPVSKTEMSVTFAQSLLWNVSDSPGRVNAVWFPQGKYWLEAQDEDYYYFRAAEDLGFKVFVNDKLVDQRRMSGGLFLNKQTMAMLPAGVYMSTSPTEKTWLLRLGSDFLAGEGPGHWTRDYEQR